MTIVIKVTECLFSLCHWWTTAGNKLILFMTKLCVCIAATNLCFAEKNVYTSEVLAVVMQQLMEQSPLPMLLMRTVIQSLTMYPRLCGFVMNILSRLIVKQVGKQFPPHHINTKPFSGCSVMLNVILSCRCGSIRRCGRDLWSAARGRSLSRSACSCSCLPHNWRACLNAARKWGSLFYIMSNPSHLIRWELFPRFLNVIHSPNVCLFNFSISLT